MDLRASNRMGSGLFRFDFSYRSQILTSFNMISTMIHPHSILPWKLHSMHLMIHILIYSYLQRFHSISGLKSIVRFSEPLLLEFTIHTSTLLSHVRTCFHVVRNLVFSAGEHRTQEQVLRTRWSGWNGIVEPYGSRTGRPVTMTDGAVQSTHIDECRLRLHRQLAILSRWISNHYHHSTSTTIIYVFRSRLCSFFVFLLPRSQPLLPFFYIGWIYLFWFKWVLSDCVRARGGGVPRLTLPAAFSRNGENFLCRFGTSDCANGPCRGIDPGTRVGEWPLPCTHAHPTSDNIRSIQLTRTYSSPMEDEAERRATRVRW